MMRFPIRTLSPLAIILSVISAAACHKAAVESVETSAAVGVEVQTVRLDTIRSSVTVTGIVTPAPGADWTITAPAPGRIAELPRHEGDSVREGDLLVRFEVPSLTADLAARQSEVAQSTARLQTARSTAERLTGLVERGIAAPRELEEARRDQAEAEAAVRQATSALTSAEALAARVVVKARFSGIVAQRWHSAGDLVDGGIGDPVLRVIDPARLEIVAAVPVSEIGRVQAGRTASIVNPGGGVLTGRVLTKPVAVDAASATGDVRVSIAAALGSRAAPGLAVGTPVQIEIVIDERSNVLVVPSAALVRDGDSTYVLLAGADRKAHRARVTVGLVTRTLTQIVAGVAAGDSVILPGADPLPDGADITIRK